ncbi:MAG: LPS-assembly protein LptD, partial [Proteobacteria bacterium]|nr:LPS-assembly protein LptD [Pseudomonadota bacterium]
ARKLVADIITYDQGTDIVYASGNVELTEPGGERIFGDRMEISGNLKDAIVESIGIILTDRSRIAAAGGRLSDATITEMRKGVYSPCNLCQDEPETPPLWQLKAVKIIHDKNSKIIEYRDVWLEVMGVPVAYTPYFSHPDPTVKRKSGFLAPSFGGSSDLGLIAQVPYFFNIAPNRDATVTALATGKEGSGGIGEYRHRFLFGSLDATASMVMGDSEDNFRGHIDAEGRFDINDTWRLGFDLNRATDDTYLRRYGFSSGNSLDSRLFAEGFRKRNYLAVNVYSFQGLREEDDADLEPLILPMIDFNHVGEPDRFGGQTVLDVNFLSLTRDEGANTRRLSIRPGWQLPFLGPLGDAYKLSFSVLGDFYQVKDLSRTDKSNFSGFSKRLVPQVSLDWRLPFVKEGGSVSQVIEPIVVAIYSPNGGNPDEIPNEDSQELEFDDTNLFSPNKFSGLDRIEDGPRLNYGLKWGVYGKKGGSASFFIGQTWRPRSSKTFGTGSGLEEEFSDVVGRVSISPVEGLNLLYRTRFSSDNLTSKRNEVAFQAGAPLLNVSVNYAFIERQQDSEFSGREEINISAASRLNRFWKMSVSGLRDIAANEMRSLNASLVYENECVIFTTRASRTFFRDRDLEPTDQLTFNVILKTLGEVRTGFSRGQ